MQNQNNFFKAFTLVELVVVITILAVLATLWFISYQWYSESSRDAVRQTNLTSLDKALSLLKMKNQSFPDPAGPTTTVEVNAVAISTQWFMSEEIANKIGVFWDLVDPISWYLPIYVLSADKQRYQIWMFQEQPKQTSLLYTREVFAKQNPYFITAWDKIGVILSSDGVPVNATNTPSVDILNTTQTYLAYIDETTKVEGTWDSLYQVNPNYDCARIFEDSSKPSGTYIINPRWEDIQVYCHRDYPDRTFYDYLVDGDFEETWVEVWDNSKKKSEAAYEWNYWMEYDSYVNVPNTNFTYINPEKNYKISWMFRSVWEYNSRLYYWFAEYDKDFIRIENNHVNVVPWTETVLTQDVNSWDKTITFENIGWNMCSKWENHPNFLSHSVVAFDIDDSGDYNDLPNRNVNPYNWGYTNYEKRQWKSMRSMINNWETCTVTFWWHMVHDYESGTKIRMHISWWAFNYRAASFSSVPYDWYEYEGTVKWVSKYWDWTSQFRRGTVFIKPVMLANYRYDWSSPDAYQNSGMILQFDNLELDAY